MQSRDWFLAIRYGGCLYPLALFLMPIHNHPDHEPEDFVYLDFVEPIEDVDIKDAPNIKELPDE